MVLHNKSQRLKERGQNLVELALVLPILFIILIGVLDLGRIFFAEIAVANAAREGVRYLTKNPTDGIGGSFSKTREVARDQAVFSGIPGDSFGVEASCAFTEGDGSCEAGRRLDEPNNKAVVTVTYAFKPIVGWVLPETITLSESASMVVP